VSKKTGKPRDRGPKPPGFTNKWRKEGKYWVNPKTGERWRFHPEDEMHYAHWDKHVPGGKKERIPVEAEELIFKEVK